MSPPDEIEFEGKTVAIWTYPQLEKLSKLNLRARAMNLRDQIGADRLPNLRLTAQPAALIQWLLNAEVSMCEALGIPLTMKDLGAPKDDAMLETGYFGGDDGSRPSTARSSVSAPPPPMAMDQSPRASVPTDGFKDPGLVAQGMSNHDDAVAVARAAALRNKGSTWDLLGGGADALDISDAPPPRAAPPPQYEAPPPQYHVAMSPRMSPAPPAPVMAQFRPASAARPTTASEESQMGYERARARNQGSFVFG